MNNLIAQEEIAQSIKDKINQFYKQPNQITNVLKKLRVILDLSVTSGSNKNVKIMQYAIDVLKMKVSDEDDIAMQVCNYRIIVFDKAYYLNFYIFINFVDL